MRGGVVQEIYSDTGEVRIVMIDWDEERELNGQVAKRWRPFQVLGAISADAKEQVDAATLEC